MFILQYKTGLCYDRLRNTNNSNELFIYVYCYSERQKKSTDLIEKMNFTIIECKSIQSGIKTGAMNWEQIRARQIQL